MRKRRRILPGFSPRRVSSIARKEVRQLWRDQLTMGFVVGIPLVQLVLFGYAINEDVRFVATAVVDQSNTSVSRRIVGELVATQAFRPVASPGEREARQMLEAGEVQAIIEIPPDFARRFYRGRGAQISIMVDASNPTLGRAIRVAASSLSDQIEKRIQPFRIAGQEGAQRSPRQRLRFGLRPELIRDRAVDFTVLNFYNPELRTAVFVVPGLLGVILTTTMIMMTALALVRERERGTLELLIATPVQRGELMVGKIIPYIAIGFVQITIVLATGLILFRVPIEGSLLSLLFASFVFIAANLALGLVISAVTKSQLQATQLSFFFFLPSVLLSGFMFPFDAMPMFARWLGEILPLTHFIRVTRALLLRGAPLWTQWSEILAMLVFFAVTLLLATRLFPRRLA